MPCDVLRVSPCTKQPHPLVGHVTGDMKRRESNETRLGIGAGFSMLATCKSFASRSANSIACDNVNAFRKVSSDSANRRRCIRASPMPHTGRFNMSLNVSRNSQNSKSCRSSATNLAIDSPPWRTRVLNLNLSCTMQTEGFGFWWVSTICLRTSYLLASLELRNCGLACKLLFHKRSKGQLVSSNHLPRRLP